MALRPGCFCPTPDFAIYEIRNFIVSFFLLCDRVQRTAVLIDTGLAPCLGKLELALSAENLGWSDIRAILLTHGHLDHTGNLFRTKARTGAWLFAHPLEQPHIDGTFSYRGASRICGLMQTVGRRLLHYRPVKIDEPLAPNAQLPFWGGLEALHLPGHTEGHCAFYSRRFDLLFSGDLFASFGPSAHLPPPFLNSCAEMLPNSLWLVHDLEPRLIFPSHTDQFDGQLHRGRFDALMHRTTTLD